MMYDVRYHVLNVHHTSNTVHYLFIITEKSDDFICQF